jgi:hypothetical protein
VIVFIFMNIEKRSSRRRVNLCCKNKRVVEESAVGNEAIAHVAEDKIS